MSHIMKCTSTKNLIFYKIFELGKNEKCMIMQEEMCEDDGRTVLL